MVSPTGSTFWSCHNFPAEMGNLLYLKLNVRCGILFFLFLIFAMRKVIFTCLDFSLRLKRRWNEPLFEPEPSPSWGPFKFVSLSLSEQTEPPLSPAVPKPSFKFDAGRGLRLDEWGLCLAFGPGPSSPISHSFYLLMEAYFFLLFEVGASYFFHPNIEITQSVSFSG